MQENKNNYAFVAGDIIFQGLNDEADFLFAVSKSGIINHQAQSDQTVDFKKINHVALYVGDGYIIEATLESGVIKQTLSQFLLKANYHVVARVKHESIIPPAIALAHKCLGKPYNQSFYLNGDGFYCSQLITHVFKTKQDKSYFDLYPMNFFDKESKKIIPYWINYYKNLKLNVPIGMLGSHPQQLLRQTDRLLLIKVYH